MLKIILMASLALGVCQSSMASSQVSFYNVPAARIFDLIKNPTSTRNFGIIDNGVSVGGTQINLDKNIQCTIHGKTSAYPTSSDEAQLALCTITADNIESIFPQQGGGSVRFDGTAAQSLFGILPKTNYSMHDNLYKRTQTMKSFGDAGIDGMMCTQVVPDDKTLATTYCCSVTWK